MGDLHFGEVGVDEFLQEYWQQKPLLIRQALPDPRGARLLGVTLSGFLDIAHDEPAQLDLFAPQAAPGQEPGGVS